MMQGKDEKLARSAQSRMMTDMGTKPRTQISVWMPRERQVWRRKRCSLPTDVDNYGEV